MPTHRAPPAPDSRTDTPTVLLVDDSVIELRLLLELLSARGIRVLVALDGQDGYDKAVRQRPDLILLDLVMPGLDGFGVCRLLKEHHATREIPVLFLSNSGELENRLVGFSLGAVDYICKPFSEAEVIARVEIHLRIGRRLAAAPHPAGPPETGAQTKAARDAAIVDLATRHLLGCLDHPPCLKELAHEVGTNEKHLNEAFQQHFSLTVFGWLREERLRQARRWLAGSDLPIGQIAGQLGYASASHLTRAFGERFGITPRELRHQESTGKTADG